MAVHAGRALFEQGIGDRRGNAQRGVLVWVYDRGTSNLSTLYTDRTKATVQDNPLSTNGLGNLAIFADPGDYEAHVDSTGAVLEFTVLPDWEDVVTGDEPEGGLPAHLADAVDAHDASAISFTPAGGVAATDVQAAIVEVAGDVGAGGTALADHLADATDSHDASAVSFVPTGGIAATTVQAALAELDADKEPTIPPGTYVPSADLSVTDAISAGAVNVVAKPTTNVLNPALTDVATVFGGTTSQPHRVLGALGVISGGYDNWIGLGAVSSIAATISGGAHHVSDAAGGHGGVGSGSYHHTHGSYSRVGGGTQCNALGEYATVGGGRLNGAGATSQSTAAVAIDAGATSFTVGTVYGRALANGVTAIVDVGTRVEEFANVTVAGSVVTLPEGSAFAAAHASSVLVYFTDGTIFDATVAGGYLNQALGIQSFVGGGKRNTASGTSSGVTGGETNTASGSHSTVSGGFTNTATANYAAVGGGTLNNATALYATVVGGSESVASGQWGVSGGWKAVASGSYSTCFGGDNTASGSYSLAVGFNHMASGLASVALGDSALADLQGKVAHASGRFVSRGDAQTSVLVARKATTDATVTRLLLTTSTSSHLILPNDTTWAFVARIVARRTDADGESAHFELKGCIDRNASAATTALVGTVTNTVIARDTAAWVVDAIADTTNGALRIDVTGEAAKTIRWVARVELVEVTG